MYDSKVLQNRCSDHEVMDKVHSVDEKEKILVDFDDDQIWHLVGGEANWVREYPKEGDKAFCMPLDSSPDLTQQRDDLARVSLGLEC